MNKAGYDHQVCPADYRRFGPLPFVLGLGIASRSNEVRQRIERILADVPRLMRLIMLERLVEPSDEPGNC